MPSRKLEPSEIADIADRIAGAATAGLINPEIVLARLGLDACFLPANVSATDTWWKIAQAVHAGKSRKAGFQADAVATLVEVVADGLGGNAELAQLGHDLGAKTPAASGGSQGVFLSYSAADRSDVDRLYDAIMRRSPSTRVFQDHRSIAKGEDWLEAIRHAAQTGAMLACWVTDSYTKSAFCSYEIGLADSKGIKVVPIWVGGTLPRTAPAYLNRPQGIPAADPLDFDSVADSLTSAL